MQKLVEADRRATGFDRSDLISHFASRAGSAVYETGGAIGLVRTGRKARQIGPVYSNSEDEAIALVERIVDKESASLVIDLSAAQSDAHEFVLSRGFVFERPFSRMRFGGGAAKACCDSGELIAIAGPEFG